MGSSQRRAYGKGGTASSRAVLSDQFFDENGIEEQMFKMSLGQMMSPLPSKDDAKSGTPNPIAHTTRKAKEVQSLVGANAEATEYTLPLLAESHKQKGLGDFLLWAERVAGVFKVIKVAEGSYGEVFKLEKRSTPQRRDAYEGGIFKLIPLRAKSSTSKSQTSLEALVREVRMLKHMDPIPGFARFRDVTVLQGPYPLSFAEAYDGYRSRTASDAFSPKPSTYPNDQLWAMIEMDDAGKDLETLTTPSAYQIFDIFWLTCCALSYAEEHTEFEHRDLHVSNICVRATEPHGTLDITSGPNGSIPTDERHNGNFGHSGLRTTIIDYTLSRARCMERVDSKPTIIYDPMRAISIFKQKGKTPEQAYQYETYRKMRTHALQVQEQSRRENPSRENRKVDKWERFLPRTNVMWLECLLFTLLFRSKGRILTGNSTLAERLQCQIYDVLKRMLGLLDGTDDRTERQKPPRSAREVIEVAHAEGLLTDQDLAAIRESLQ